MTSTTPRASLPLLAAAQAQKHVTHNEALLQLDALVFARFLDRDLTAPPGSPADGDTYLIHATATGDWTGQDGNIAYCVDGAWRFAAPFTGLAAYVVDECRLVVFNGSAWVDYASILYLANVPLVGVNTTADATNKLAVKSSAVLFDNIGNGIQAKLNKHATGDTASLLYQTNYSGHAEIGLTGDDNFHFKVSPDGASWFDGLDIANADGAVDFLASEATVASAATADIGATPSLKVQITGATTITSFGTKIHKLRFVRFAGALTLTHNATSLILLGGASRTTAAGDVATYASDASGNWRERSYFRAASNAGDTATKSGTETFANKTLNDTVLAGIAYPDASGTRDLGKSTAAFRDFYASRSLLVGATALTSDWATSGANGQALSTSYPTLSLASSQADGGGIRIASLAFEYATNNAGYRTLAVIEAATQASGTANKRGGYISFRTQADNSAGPGERARLSDSVFQPGSDNSQTLGSASLRWSTVYAATGSINTSGAATKTGTRALSDAEIAVAKTLAGNVRVFQFCDAVARKGAGGARLHAGMIFEEVVAAFAAQDLDPMQYGIVCRDPAMKIVVLPGGPDGQPIEDVVPDLDEAGAPKWTPGLRYEELAQFVIAGLAALEAK